MAGRAWEMYDARFDLRHTVDALRSGSHANSARR
jgi:hypothetical protein